MKQGASQSAAAKSSPINEAGRFMLRFQSYFGLIAIVVISALLSPTRNGINVFLTPPNLLNIVRFASENGIIAVGMTLVILIGGIDLSVGAVLALCAVATSAFLMRMGLGTLPTIVLVLSIGLGVGLISGLVTNAAESAAIYHHPGHAQHRARRRFALVGGLCHPPGLWAEAQ